MPRCTTPAALLPLGFLVAACGGETAPDADLAFTHATVVDVETGELPVAGAEERRAPA